MGGLVLDGGRAWQMLVTAAAPEAVAVAVLGAFVLGP